MSPRCVVVVLDASPDTREMLKTFLELDGFVVATASPDEFRLGSDDLIAFLDRVCPDVIVYDLGIPYESNWHFLQAMQDNPTFARCGLVITTTNQRVVESLTAVRALEIVGKPYDLAALSRAVRQAAQLTDEPS